MDHHTQPGAAEIFPPSLFVDPFELGLCPGCLEQLVVRAEGIEQRIGMAQQLLPPFLPHADGIGKNAERVGTRQIRHTVEAAAFQKSIRHRLGRCLEMRAQGPQHRR